MFAAAIHALPNFSDAVIGPVEHLPRYDAHYVMHSSGQGILKRGQQFMSSELTCSSWLSFGCQEVVRYDVVQCFKAHITGRWR